MPEQKASKLEKDVTIEKPILHLTPLNQTAISVPTKEEYDTLMRVYEHGGWRRHDGNLPTFINNWDRYSKRTCIDAGISIFGDKERFGYADKSFYLSQGRKVISTQEFYDIQNITPDNLQKINEYFMNRRR